MQMKTRKKSGRAPVARAVPKSAKANLGRSVAAAAPPTAIRAQGLSISDDVDSYVRDRLGRKLGKFALHITRSSVRFVDVAGPKGEPTIVCRIKTVFPNLSSVIVESRHHDVREAFDDAIDAHERAVRRMLEKHDRTTKPKPAISGRA